MAVDDREFRLAAHRDRRDDVAGSGVCDRRIVRASIESDHAPRQGFVDDRIRIAARLDRSQSLLRSQIVNADFVVGAVAGEHHAELVRGCDAVHAARIGQLADQCVLSVSMMSV